MSNGTLTREPATRPAQVRKKASRYATGGPGSGGSIRVASSPASSWCSCSCCPTASCCSGRSRAVRRSCGSPTYFPEQWHPDNYVTMWSTPETPLPQNLVSTIVISVAATVLVLIVALPAAYFTARFRFPGRMAFLFLVLVTQMLQPAVLVAGLFRQFLAFGIVDTWLAMILVNAAFNLAFAVWIMHSFFASVPKEIDEAAQIDGAGRWATLFRINLPLVWPGIVTAIIFTFVAAWNEFAASLVILSTAGNQPLSVALTKFVGQYDSAWQYVFGVSIVAIVPVIVLFAIIEKRLVGV
ncbi:carbohydrate ABC transporter permease [Oerskovia sp. M15]